jgi:hypothetical protein
MAVTCVSIEHNGDTGRATMESDLTDFPLAISELQNGATRQAAIVAASQKGLPDPRVGMNNSVYPVNAAGELLKDPLQDRIHRYRIDVELTRRMV